MTHQVVWAKCSVTNPDTGEDVILSKGDMLPDWVSDFTRFVLVSTGGVRVVAEPDPVLLAALPEPVRLPEHPDPPLTEEQQRAKAAERAERDDAPPRSASKDAWRQHALAVEVGRGRDEAEVRAELDPFTRDELVERYGR